MITFENLLKEAHSRDFRNDVLGNLLDLDGYFRKLRASWMSTKHELTSPADFQRMAKEVVCKIDPETKCQVYYTRISRIDDDGTQTVVSEEVLRPKTHWPTPTIYQPVHSHHRIDGRKLCDCEMCKQCRRDRHAENTALRKARKAEMIMKGRI